MEYKFERNRSDKIPKSKILEQLEKVAQKKNFIEFSIGRSPATDIGIKLHIDHKVPFSKCGKTTIDNFANSLSRM